MSASEKAMVSHIEDAHGSDPVLAAFSRTVKGYKDPVTGARGATALAEKVGIGSAVLSNKANLNMPDCEPTLTQTRKVMKAAGDFGTLQALNEDCGFVMVPVEAYKPSGDGSMLERYLQLELSRGKETAAMHHALQHKKITHADVHRIRESILRSRADEEALLAALNAWAEG